MESTSLVPFSLTPQRAGIWSEIVLFCQEAGWVHHILYGEEGWREGVGLGWREGFRAGVEEGGRTGVEGGIGAGMEGGRGIEGGDGVALCFRRMRS